MAALQGITRRQFVGGAAAAAAAVSAGGVGLLVSPVGAAKPGGGTSSRVALAKPTLWPAKGELTAAPATKGALAYTFDGGALPVFEHTRGSEVAVDFVNGLGHETTVHWHGLIVPPAVDGQPTEAVPPGGSFAYGFTVNQRASLNFFHPHPHMHTGEQVALGLQGMFLIRDSEEAGLGLPSGEFEWPLAVRDANYDRKGNITYAGRNSGEFGTVALVNGVKNPKIVGRPGTYRLRLLNSSNARIFRWSFGGLPFWLIGNDGGLLAAPVEMREVLAGPAERFDILINLPVGLTMLRCLDARWDLLQFEISGTAGATVTPQADLSDIETLSADGAPLRTFSFDGMSRINGQVYSPDMAEFSVPRGVVERWRFSTGGNAPHPVHIHGASFQVIERRGGRVSVYPWERGWKDTVLLLDGETVDVLIRFSISGRYLIHCHKLEHEDSGMMLPFVVG